MLYDVRLQLHYAYDAEVRNDRHLLRVLPISGPAQRVVAASLAFDPRPVQESQFLDFFGNIATELAYTAPHDHLDVRLTARIEIEDRPPGADLSPTRDGLALELSRVWSVSGQSPHHFLGRSPRVSIEPEITAYAAEATAGTASILGAAMALCRAIHRDFSYDAEATAVETTPAEAFALKKGVCQDFSHIMIAGLRGLGIPAGYVSGFLRTLPPRGRPRLEGADAMHAWVRVWCGQHMGWIDVDPTNAMRAGVDHLTIGHGRDYADISPIVGVLRTRGTHRAEQSVDVVTLE